MLGKVKYLRMQPKKNEKPTKYFLYTDKMTY